MDNFIKKLKAHRHKINTTDLWNNNYIQFCRLIAEIDYEGGFKRTLIEKLCNAMDLEKNDIFNLIDRAKEEHEKFKVNL